MRIVSILLLIILLGLVFLYLVKTKGKEYTIFLALSICYFVFMPLNLVPKIVLYIVLFIIIKIYAFFKFKRNCSFDTYFGVPGSGKTTIAAWLAKNRLKKGRNVYSNVSILGAYEIDKSDIGKYKIENGLLLLDECGSEYNSRNFKAMPQEQIEWFKKHRQYQVDVVCFSQFWNDIDVILRNLSTNLYLIKPSLIPFFIKRKRIGKRISVDKETKQIIDEYYFVPFSGFYFFAPGVWKMFKTHDIKEYPNKDFKIYSKEEIMNYQENVEASESESIFSDSIQARARRVE